MEAGEAASGANRPVRVWDAAIRLFHWAVVVLVLVSWLSVQYGRMQIHLWSGYTVMAALLFRLVWGFIGSDTARFGAFLASPLAGLRHLRHLTRREADTQVGHNAAGGWMVLLLLFLLAVQVGTGLFANTFADFDINGAFARSISKSLSNRLTDVHAFNFNLILAAIGLHVCAVLAYAVLKGQNLLRPMITGIKRLPEAVPPPRLRGPLLAAAIFACAAVLVAIVATRP